MSEKKDFGNIGASSRKLIKKKSVLGILNISMLLTAIPFLLGVVIW